MMIDRPEQFILAQSQQSLARNALHNLHQRLARWLMRIRDITDSNTLRVTQDSMSELLGIRRTSISMVVGSFQHMGWISYAQGYHQLE
jgi:CRP-like cAMP-binding protein